MTTTTEPGATSESPTVPAHVAIHHFNHVTITPIGDVYRVLRDLVEITRQLGDTVAELDRSLLVALSSGLIGVEPGVSEPEPAIVVGTAQTRLSSSPRG